MKRVLKISSFLIILVGLLFLSGKLLEPKNNLKEFGMKNASSSGILGEKENSIDVVILGDSEAYSNISPMEMWHSKGIVSYVSASSAQLLYETENYLLQALEKQSPKVVILETNAIFRDYTLTMTTYNNLKRQFKIFEYHDSWKKFNPSAFLKRKNYTYVDDYKGYRFSKKVSAAKEEDYMSLDVKEAVIPKLNQRKLDSMIKLCKDKNIELVLVSTPSTVNWNKAKHEAVSKLAKENNLTYLDLNLVDLKIDWSKDTRDKGDHLNYYGAKKVSLYLADYLAKNYGLSDKSNDKTYANWHDSYKRYERNIAL